MPLNRFIKDCFVSSKLFFYRLLFHYVFIPNYSTFVLSSGTKSSTMEFIQNRL